MNKHICYLFILLFTVISQPLSAADAEKPTEVIAPQNILVVDINKADVDTLASLKGIGEKKAIAIVAYRELNGDFNTVDDLLNVKGIGEQTLHLNKEKIKL